MTFDLFILATIGAVFIAAGAYAFFMGGVFFFGARFFGSAVKDSASALLVSVVGFVIMALGWKILPIVFAVEVVK